MPPRLAAAAVALLIVGASCSGAEPEPEDPTAFCAAIGQVAGPSGALEQLRDLDDPEAAEVAVDELRSLNDIAPQEISDDVRAMVTGFDDLVTALVAPDNRSVAEVLSDLEAELMTAGEAADRVEQYAAARCGLDLNPAPTPTPAPLPGSEDDLRPA